jgi:tRNA threonylcarbamoyladenosine biosynthesis protein TsaB
MNTILCIETSGLVCSVSLAQNGDCKSFKSISDEQYRHAEVLHTLVAEVLQETNVKLTELSAIAISKGPGSYTGLRVGVSSAKGFCYTLKIPLIAINTLYLIALEAKNQTNEKNITPVRTGTCGGFTAMIDARRDEVYLQEFDLNLNELSNPQPVILSNYHPTNNNIVFCGDGCEKSKVYFEKNGNTFIPDAKPLANNMCKIANEKFEKSEFENVVYFEPFYLKEFYIKEK